MKLGDKQDNAGRGNNGGDPQGTPQVKAKIEEEKAKRAQLIDQMRRLRSKLNYKQAEYAALSKLAETGSKATKNVGRLRKLKSGIEFRIATEAKTLGAEKELIKRLSDVSEELEEALKSFRFRRKLQLVAKDMEDIGKALESYKTQVLDVDKKLDALYESLRGLTGWKKKEEWRPRRQPKQGERFEISLEDIATIKNKNKEEK